ncbi:eukaryotic translation initiation factor 5B-like [Daphnia pulicaria]|uniref:eukaryotic translation initiation factor 5B-like n=1 Tax=Daphnia pulicaria TaxID=35523 RepID=UPI001EEAC521|nr:eukaryotic translation initiation factor 5B-like [Daphnia pulicaria]XP_046651252.1 eukaryotic translation initiation factor 5B-like [Daphnia pulicaria]
MTKKNVKKAKEESDGLATAEPEPAEDLFEEENSDKKKKKKKKKGKDDDANEASETVEKVEEVDEDQDDKKNKKAKKKVEKVDPKKDKKGGPGKKAIAAMQETLRKIKEEEDRIRREEEEAERKAEEEERIRLEQERKEQERRDLKKQREKEKRDRLKAEGKFLTPKQRAAQARSQASLEILRAQGVDVPLIGEKRPRAGTRVRTNKQQQAVAQTDESTTSEENKAEQKPDGESEVLVEEEEEEVKESWDAESSSEEEVEEEPVPTTTAETTHSKSKSESEDSDDSDEEDDSDDSSDSDNEDGKKTDALSRRERALNRIQKRRDEAEKNTDPEVLRAPVVCVLGHVDTGKTKILDKLRRTHVQDGEAGGITQQIGATNVPIEAIREQSKMVIGFQDMKLKIPGLLIIDTPGHESFSNLRSRGSSLCDIAILVVDIMHGLEPQTIESLNLLKAKKTPFVVALNKIDRLYDWISNPKKDVKDLIKSQAKNTQLEFQDRAKLVITQLAEQSMNAAVFYENPDSRSYVSMVPTSAATGDGMGNLMSLIVELTQTALAKRLMYTDELQATVLEVKAIPGYGTTVDIILINGTLHESDTIVLAGTDGPIVTQIRSLLLPQPMKELRVKNTYTEPKEVRAAQGVKITAKDLEKAIAGLNLLVAYHPDEVEICKEEVAHELKSALGRIKLQDRGVYVQASTLGSLEALLEFLKTSEIPYANIRIGPVVKKDVMKASTMLEHNAQYAVILAFDVKIERDAQEMADSVGVKIFQADIIYHLFDSFMKYRDELKAKKREEFKDVAVFPCKLRILPQFIFNTRDPIVVGVVVENGIVKEGTPLCVPTKEFVCIGIVTNIEVNHKAIETARKGQEVCIKISPTPGDSPKLYGRHFDHTDLLVSKISRESIDACKEYFRDDLQKPDWQLMVELKKLFQIL